MIKSTIVIDISYLHNCHKKRSFKRMDTICKTKAVSNEIRTILHQKLNPLHPTPTIKRVNSKPKITLLLSMGSSRQKDGHIE